MGKHKRVLLSAGLWMLASFGMPIGATASDAGLSPELAQAGSNTHATLPLSTYVARYRGASHGLSRDDLGKRVLTRTKSGDYLLSMEAEALLYRSEEQARFSWSAGELQPLTYRAVTGNFLKERKSRLTFDWPRHTVVWSYKDKDGTFPLEPQTRDALTSSIEVGLQLRAGEDEVKFLEAQRGRTKHKTYRVVDRPTINTEAGRIETIHLREIEDDPDKETEIWVHQQHPHIPVRVVQRDEGERSLLELTTLELPKQEPQTP